MQGFDRLQGPAQGPLNHRCSLSALLFTGHSRRSRGICTRCCQGPRRLIPGRLEDPMPARPARLFVVAAVLALSAAAVAPAAAEASRHGRDKHHRSGSFSYAV